MSSIGPVGNTIYVNQQTAAVAGDKNALLNRMELQNFAAAEAANSKQKEVEEVRPTEENHKIDEEREHTKQEAEEENSKERDPDEENDEENSDHNEPPRLLDITV